MFTPTYVARKVGDDYEMVRIDVSAVLARVASVAAGTAILGYGLWRRGMIGLVAGIAGGGLLYNGLTGRNPVKECVNRQRRQKWLKSQTASARNDPFDQVVQVPSDPLEEAQIQSFPASDPPASMRTNRPEPAP